MAEAHRETIPWVPFRSCHRLVARVYIVEKPPRQHKCTNSREECHVNSYGGGGGGGRRYGEEGEILAEVAVGRWGAGRGVMGRLAGGGGGW